jgi:hypothetical protein
MAGIRTALETGYDIITGCEIIHDLSLPFITPLQAKYYINHLLFN